MVGETSPVLLTSELFVSQRQSHQQPDEFIAVVHLYSCEVRRKCLYFKGLCSSCCASYGGVGLILTGTVGSPNTRDQPVITSKYRLKRSWALTTTFALAALSLNPNAAGGATTYDQIQGSGSSWAANAINQWVGDVGNQGMKVVFTANGSAQDVKTMQQGLMPRGIRVPYQGRPDY